MHARFPFIWYVLPFQIYHRSGHKWIQAHVSTTVSVREITVGSLMLSVLVQNFLSKTTKDINSLKLRKIGYHLTHLKLWWRWRILDTSLNDKKSFGVFDCLLHSSFVLCTLLFSIVFLLSTWKAWFFNWFQSKAVVFMRQYIKTTYSRTILWYYLTTKCFAQFVAECWVQ